MKRALPVALMIVLAVACRKSASPVASAEPLAPAESAASAAASARPPRQPTAPAAPVQPPTPAKPVPAQLPAVVATVDGEKIERWELEGAIKAVEARAGSPIPADKRDEVLRGLIDQLVAYHVLAHEAHDRKLDATEAEVTARLAQIKGGFPNEQAFQEALKAQSMTLERLQQQTRMGMQINKIIEAEVASKISVQDAEVDAFYKQNRPQFEQGESVHASHILIMAPQAADAATEAGGQVEGSTGAEGRRRAAPISPSWRRSSRRIRAARRTAATSASSRRARPTRPSRPPRSS